MNAFELIKEYLILISQSAVFFTLSMGICHLVGLNKATNKTIIFSVIVLLLANVLIMIYKHR